jgi:hypothetical protein
MSVTEYRLQQFVCIFLFLFLREGQLALGRHSIFIRTRHILQLPVVLGWNPPAGVGFAITLCFKYWFSGCRWIQQGFGAH